MSDQMTGDRVDRQIREFLAWQGEDTHGAPSMADMAGHISARSVPTVITGRVTSRLVWVVLLGLLLALAVATAAFFGGRSRVPTPLRFSNGWVAYSTQPGWVQVGSTDFSVGGDIFLVREGIAPKLIVSRGPDTSTNVCPRFSPDGSLLAYGESKGSTRGLVAVGVSETGEITERARINVPGTGLAPCAEWARDGTALAYRDRHETGPGVTPDFGTLILVSLGGSVLQATAADPQLDFVPTVDSPSPDSFSTPLVSPDGEKAVFQDERGLVVTDADGLDPRVIAERSLFYSIAAWSPDSQYVLAMEDSSAVMLVAVSVAEPHERLVLAPSIAINGFRSYPGLGDVSWQPTFTSETDQ